MSLTLMDVARTAVASSPEMAQSARLHLADACIAHSLGVQTPQAARMRAAWQLTPASSAMAALPWHAACMRLSEVDDIHRHSAVTAAAMVVPTALAVAQWQQSTPTALAGALTAGYRVALQLGVAMGGARLLAQGLWPSYLVAPYAAAATAGHLLGLDEGAMAHALSLALSQTGRSVGRSQGEWPGRWWLFGQAVQNGCQAAMAAQQGMQGDLGLLNPAWLQSVGGAGAVALAHAPANPWREMSFKPHCAAKQTLSALHAFQQLLGQGLRVSDIDRIEVLVAPAYAAMIDREPPTASRLASMVSVRWQLTLAAWAPERLDDVLRTPMAGDADWQTWSERVSVHVEPAWDNVYPAQWPATVRVHTAAKVWEARALDSWGDPALPWSEADVLDKAQRMLVNTTERALVPLALDALHDAQALRQLLQAWSP
jgi:2-methylcitrate dehydratase PrpD